MVLAAIRAAAMVLNDLGPTSEDIRGFLGLLSLRRNYYTFYVRGFQAIRYRLIQYLEQASRGQAEDEVLHRPNKTAT